MKLTLFYVFSIYPYYHQTQRQLLNVIVNSFKREDFFLLGNIFVNDNSLFLRMTSHIEQLHMNETYMQFLSLMGQARILCKYCTRNWSRQPTFSLKRFFFLLHPNVVKKYRMSHLNENSLYPTAFGGEMNGFLHHSLAVIYNGNLAFMLMVRFSKGLTVYYIIVKSFHNQG